ncbi:hypothetical protein GCM10027395_01380 [Giesbergeria sinuosa]
MVHMDGRKQAAYRQSSIGVQTIFLEKAVFVQPNSVRPACLRHPEGKERSVAEPEKLLIS